MKKILLLLFFILFANVSFAKETINVYIFSTFLGYPGYYVENDIPKGFYPDLLVQIFDKENFELVYNIFESDTDLHTDNGISKIPYNSVVVGIIKTPARDIFFDFSSTYIKESFFYLFKRSNRYKFKNEDFFLSKQDHAVFTVAGTALEAYLRSSGVLGINYFEYKKAGDGFFSRNLKDDEFDNDPQKADAVFIPVTAITPEMERDKQFILFPSKYATSVSFAILKPTNIDNYSSVYNQQLKTFSQEALKHINKRIMAIKKNKVLEKLLVKYNISAEITEW